MQCGIKVSLRGRNDILLGPLSPSITPVVSTTERCWFLGQGHKHVHATVSQQSLPTIALTRLVQAWNASAGTLTPHN